MIIPHLAKRLCRDLLVEAQATDVGSVATTSFEYPNGDSVCLYFSDFGDTLCVSDEGATVSFLKNQGIDLPGERRSAITRMCRPFDVEFVTPALRRQFKLPEIGIACLGLCEAITAVSSILYHVESPLRSSLPVSIDAILRKRVQPKRGVERHWIDRRHDPEGSLPVDFRMNGIGEPRNIFPVTSSGKSLMVVAVANFLRSHRIKGRSLAVIDKEAELGHTDLNRLQLATDEIIIGLEEKESTLVRFALAS